jgi:hypothetical protein
MVLLKITKFSIGRIFVEELLNLILIFVDCIDTEDDWFIGIIYFARCLLSQQVQADRS